MKKMKDRNPEVAETVNRDSQQINKEVKKVMRRMRNGKAIGASICMAMTGS